MSRLDKHESSSNLTIEYTLNDYQHDVFSWLFWVANSGILQIRRIQLDNLLDEGDENSDSLVLGKIISKERIKELTAQNGTDVISIVAKFNGLPVVVGVDLRSNLPFITVRKNEMANYDLLEQKLQLI